MRKYTYGQDAESSFPLEWNVYSPVGSFVQAHESELQARIDCEHLNEALERGRASILDGIDALAERHGPQLFLLQDEEGDYHAYTHLKEDGSGLLVSACQYAERGEQLSGALLAALE